jgi:hypothetical protein
MDFKIGCAFFQSIWDIVCLAFSGPAKFEFRVEFPRCFDSSEKGSTVPALSWSPKTPGTGAGLAATDSGRAAPLKGHFRGKGRAENWPLDGSFPTPFPRFLQSLLNISNIRTYLPAYSLPLRPSKD